MLVTAVAGVATLSGCGFLFPPDPPSSVSGALDEAVEAIRDLDGVGSAMWTASADRKDGGPLSKPDAWSAHITVAVSPGLPDLEALAADVAYEVASARGTVKTTGTMRLRADRNGPATVLEFAGNDSPETPADIAAAAELLRSVSGATSVFVALGSQPASVSTSSSAGWAETAAELRRLPGFGSGALASVAIDGRDAFSGRVSRILIDALTPSAALIPLLSELAGRADVISFHEGPTRSTAEAGSVRPIFRIEVRSREAVARFSDTLTGIDGGLLVDGRPRPAFTVYASAGETTTEHSGFLGLPLGADEPDDLAKPSIDDLTPEELAARSDGPLIVLSPDAAAERLEADRLATMALLTDAGDLAGVPGTVTVSTAGCEVGVGEQQSGSVVIPVFEIADSADEALDAITASWLTVGYSASDRAMGTDFYTSADALQGGVATASIRGGVEGITIRTTSTCVVSR
ncbi:hypothetical protein EV379_2686 [Microterricola gilva]|uniref:Uncharacterized protein n=1 Tax=Microterricola gilva TaxID=393267 RepID=A0A4Q8ANU1_9MICO|nr:hypothetical protein [Microterricola gilva]RZU66332.1 hypothetical protein EV379_2686 [Microterricola gilva]